MPFRCEKCLKDFPGQQHLDNHINRKKPCISDENVIADNICEFCNNEFSCSRNLERHYPRCVVRNNNTLLFQHYQKQKELLLEKNKLLEQKDVIIEQMKATIAEITINK